MGATSSAAFGNDTKFVRLSTDNDCYVNPLGTATTTVGSGNFLLTAGVYFDMAVNPSTTISAITSSGNATLQIIEFGGRDHKGNDNVLWIEDSQTISVTT